MNRFFNFFRKNKTVAAAYRQPELVALEELMKYNTDPYERYNTILKSSPEGIHIISMIHKLQDKWLVTPEEIHEAFGAFAEKQQSNAASIAQLFFAVTAQLGYYRNDCTPLLLIYPMRAFYYATGSVEHRELVQFIQESLIEYKLTPYGGLPPNGEINWLKEYVEKSEALVHELFQQLIEEN